MAIIAMEKAYPKIIAEYKIRAIGRPEISITKMEENNPLGFKNKDGYFAGDNTPRL